MQLCVCKRERVGEGVRKRGRGGCGGKRGSERGGRERERGREVVRKDQRLN